MYENMCRSYNIEELKTELIGKQVNWLVVIDVYKNR